MAQLRALEDFRLRLVTALAADDRVEAVLEAGSNAVGMGDRYSDLDIVIVATDDDYEALLADRLSLAHSLGSMISSFSGEHVGEPRLLICLFGIEHGDRLLHVDLKIIRRGDLLHRVDDPRVLFDHAQACGPLMSERPAVWPERDPQWFEDRIWIWLHYAAGRAARGEVFEAIDAISFIRGQVLGPMLARAAGQPQRGVRRIEQIPGAAEALWRAHAMPTRADMRRALLATCELYGSLRSPAPPLVSRAEAEARVIDYIQTVL